MDRRIFIANAVLLGSSGLAHGQIAPRQAGAANALPGKWTDGSNYYYIYPNGFFVMVQGNDRWRVGYGKFGSIGVNPDPTFWQFVGTWISYPKHQSDNGGGPLRMRQSKAGVTLVAWLTGNGNWDPNQVLDDVALQQLDPSDPPQANTVLPELDIILPNWRIVQVSRSKISHLVEGDSIRIPGVGFSLLGTTSIERLIVALGTTNTSTTDSPSAGSTVSGIIADVPNQIGGQFTYHFPTTNLLEGTLIFDQEDDPIEFAAVSSTSK